MALPSWSYQKTTADGQFSTDFGIGKRYRNEAHAQGLDPGSEGEIYCSYLKGPQWINPRNWWTGQVKTLSFFLFKITCCHCSLQIQKSEDYQKWWGFRMRYKTKTANDVKSNPKRLIAHVRRNWHTNKTDSGYPS